MVGSLGKDVIDLVRHDPRHGTTEKLLSKLKA